MREVPQRDEEGETDVVSVYEPAHGALLAMDLLRRDPTGLADRLAAIVLRVADGMTAAQTLAAPATEDGDWAEVTRSRQVAFAAAVDGTLWDITAASIESATRSQRAAWVLGTGVDVWQALHDFIPVEPVDGSVVTVVADAVLAIWARNVIPLADFLVLTNPARVLIDAIPDSHQLSFEPRTAGMHALLRQVQSFAAVDFMVVESDDDVAEDGDWEAAMAEASWAADVSGRLVSVAHAQLVALGALGAIAHEVEVPLGPLIVAATTLAGAVQATMLTDMLPVEVVNRLIGRWGS